jgi:hypothetical protein
MHGDTRARSLTAGGTASNRTWRSAGIMSAAGCTSATLVSSAPVVNATFGVFLVPLSAGLDRSRADVSFLRGSATPLSPVSDCARSARSTA